MTKETRDSAAPSEHEPVVRARGEHPIHRRDVNPHALKVVYRLERAGHTAYLVGGGVRDLLLERTPKDFDVSTSARPNQIKRLFRNCWLIGRRFRLAHIKYDGVVIETATFRKAPDPEENGDDLLITSDNTFGTAEEDARRRDFTINGLFYEVESGSVLDWVGGLDDLAARKVRCIGDPHIRFREDPVRMLRAVRFAARLGFEIESETRAALDELVPEIDKASPARLYEELMRFFGFGAGAASFRLLRETGLLRHILPVVSEYLDTADDEEEERYWKYLEQLDAVLRDDGEDDPDRALMMATLLSPIVRNAYGPDATLGGVQSAVRPVVDRLSDRVNFANRRRVFHDAWNILLMQQRLMYENNAHRWVKAVRLQHFDNALALYGFVTAAEGAPAKRLNAWRVVQSAVAEGASSEEAVAALDVDDLGLSGQAKKKKRRGRRKSRRSRKKSSKRNAQEDGKKNDDGDASGSDDTSVEENAAENASAEKKAAEDAGSDQDAPKKKRSRSSRRRRGRRKKKRSSDNTDPQQTDASTDGDASAKESSSSGRDDGGSDDSDNRSDDRESSKKKRSGRKRSRKKTSPKNDGDDSGGADAGSGKADSDAKGSGDADGKDAKNSGGKPSETGSAASDSNEPHDAGGKDAGDSGGKHSGGKDSSRGSGPKRGKGGSRKAPIEDAAHGQRTDMPHWLDEI